MPSKPKTPRAPQPAISEAPIKTHVYEEMVRFSRVTQLELGFDVTKNDAVMVAEWVDTLTHQWQNGKTPPKEIVSDEDLPLLLGFTWGEQIVAAHGWQWVDLTFHEHGDWETMAVVSSDRSLMILPFAFVHECITEHIDVTVGMSIKAIGSSLVPKFPPKSYTNLMHGLHRIVPRI